MKHFELPSGYRSNLISAIKQKRKEEDNLKKDFSPTLIDLGIVKFGRYPFYGTHTSQFLTH